MFRTKKHFKIGNSKSLDGVEFSSDGKNVAILDASNTITIWDVNTNKKLKHYNFKKRIGKFCWRSNDDYIGVITSASPFTVAFWNISENRTKNLHFDERMFTSICWHHKDYIACGTVDGKITVISITRSFGRKKNPPTSVCCKSLNDICVSPSSKYLVAVRDNNNILIWRIGKDEIKVVENPNPVNSVCFAPKDDYFAALATNGEIIIRKIDNGIVKKSCILKGHTAVVQGVYYNSTGNLLVSYDSNNLVIVWNLKTRHRLYTLNEKNSFSIKSICWGPKNKKNEEKIIVFAEEKRKPTLFFYTVPCKKSVFSPEEALFEQLPSLFATDNMNITNYSCGAIEKYVCAKIEEASLLLNKLWEWYESNKKMCSKNYKFNIARIIFCFGVIVKGFCAKIAKKIDLKEFNKINELGWKTKKLRNHIQDLKKIKQYRALYRTGPQKNLCDKTIAIFRTFFEKYSDSNNCGNRLNLTRIAYLILLSKDERCSKLKGKSADFLRGKYLADDIIVLNLHHWEKENNKSNSFEIGKTEICSESRLRECFSRFYLRRDLACSLFDPRFPGNCRLDAKLTKKFKEAQKVIEEAEYVGKLTEEGVRFLCLRYVFGSSINDNL